MSHEYPLEKYLTPNWILRIVNICQFNTQTFTLALFWVFAVWNDITSLQLITYNSTDWIIGTLPSFAKLYCCLKKKKHTHTLKNTSIATFKIVDILSEH